MPGYSARFATLLPALQAFAMGHDLSSGVMWYAVFVLSTVCHEAAHAWAAHRMGDDTARKGGQVTLNPGPHIRREPMGMVLVPIASWLIGGWMVGWASTPYNVEWSRNNPRKAALMAVAGPAANLSIAVVAGLLIRLGYEWGLFAHPYATDSLGGAPGMPPLAGGNGGESAALAARILSIFLSLNLLLCVFNMVPLPPLDGSQVPLLLLPRGAADSYARALRSPFLRYIGILVAWRFIPSILPPLVQAFTRVIYA
jgi:Zn-dependent protease